MTLTPQERRQAILRDPDKRLWLKLHYPHLSNTTIALYLDITPADLTSIARRLSLRKSDELKRERNRDRCRRYRLRQKQSPGE